MDERGSAFGNPELNQPELARVKIEELKEGSTVFCLEAAVAMQVGKLAPAGYELVADFFRNEQGSTTPAHNPCFLAEAEVDGRVEDLQRDFPDVPHLSEKPVIEGVLIPINAESTKLSEASPSSCAHFPSPIEIVDATTREEEFQLAEEEVQEQKAFRMFMKRKHSKHGDRSQSPLPLASDEGDKLNSVNFTTHGRERKVQRNLSDSDIMYVLEHGVRIQKTGVTFIHLRERDIPEDDRMSDEITRLEGTTILMDSKNVIITCYRNKKALRDIRHKHNERIFQHDTHGTQTTGGKHDRHGSRY